MPQERTNRPAPGLGHKRSKEMYAYTLANQGGTFTAFGLPVSSTHGFVLSLDPGRGEVIPLRDFSPTNCEVFALNNQHYILDYNRDMPEPMRGLKMLGTWVFDEEVHVDVVSILITKDINSVMQLAREHNQQSVWDFSTGKEIFVDRWFEEMHGMRGEEATRPVQEE